MYHHSLKRRPRCLPRLDPKWWIGSGSTWKTHLSDWLMALTFSSRNLMFGKCWVLLQANQQLNADKFSTLIELFNVFAGSVGHSARWHQGCPCHDHVWTRSDISEARKAQIMLELSGGVSSTCWRKGRRASELARGHAKELADGVKRATSYRLQQRLARLDDQDRKVLLHIFKVLKSSWCEEFLEKSHYHTLLPHLAAGLWPVDSGCNDC